MIFFLQPFQSFKRPVMGEMLRDPQTVVNKGIVVY